MCFCLCVYSVCFFFGSFLLASLIILRFVLFCLSYLILLLSRRCLFSKERQTGCGSRWEGRREVTRRNRGRKNHNQNTFYEKKSIFNKRTNYFKLFSFHLGGWRDGLAGKSCGWIWDGSVSSTQRQTYTLQSQASSALSSLLWFSALSILLWHCVYLLPLHMCRQNTQICKININL